MPGFKRVIGWLKRDSERAVDEELRSHIDMKAEELIEGGMDPDRAHRRARESFGDLGRIRRETLRVQAQTRERRAAAALIDGLRQDARFAARALLRSPGFSAVAIATLALGIGANTAIFSIVNGLMLRPLPGIERPEDLVEIAQGDGDDYISVSYPVFDHVRRHTETLSDIAAFDVISLTLGDDGPAEVYFGLQVTGNYFDLLGVAPAAGRFFAPDRSFPPDVEDAVVISHALWQRRFGGSDAALGRGVTLSGHPARIVGVAPPGFGGHVVAAKADLFVLIGLAAPEVHHGEVLGSPRNGMLETVGRVADTATVDAVREEVAALADAFIRDLEGPDASYPLQTTSYSAVPGSVRAGATTFFSILIAIVGVLLLLTCVNVANMLISRATVRSREVAVRLSLGAGRGRLVRQLLTESLVLSSVATATGVLLSIWLSGLVMAFEPPVLPFPGMRLELDFGLDARVLGFSVLLAVFTTTAFGLVPALRATRPEIVPALKDATGARGAGKASLRRILVAGQMATTIVLLLGSGLFLRALHAAETVDTGFRTHGVHVANFDLRLNDYDQRRALQFYGELLDRVRSVAGVRMAAVAGKLPLAGASSTTMAVPGFEPAAADAPDGGVPFSLHNQSVSADYFEVLDLPLLRGRTFRSGDGPDAPVVAVVNETLANRFWTVATAVGRRFDLYDGTPVRIVGVVADAKYHRLVEETPLFVCGRRRAARAGGLLGYAAAGPQGIARQRRGSSQI